MPGRWSLRRRVVALVAAVALVSSLLTGWALTRVLVSSNRLQAAVTVTAEADALAGLVEQGATLRVVARVRRLEALPGWAVEIVGRDGAPTVVPFTAADPSQAPEGYSGAVPVERTVSGTDWFVAARSAGSRTVLIARRVSAATELTPQQRRGTVLGALLGLVVGGLGGLVLARSITRPLERVAGAARRLSAGERDVGPAPEGPAEVAVVAEALGALSSALATSEQRQRRFLLAVSHELRTPLTAIAGHAETLAEGVLPADEVAPAAGVIVSEAARLQRRVEDLLALARLEADDFRLTWAAVDLAAVVRAAAAAAAPRAAAAGVRVEVEAPTRGLVATTDGERMRQMVDALLDNAIRVLPPGGRAVLAARAVAAAVRVEVRDDGPGLAPRDLAVAFERGVLTERYRGSRPVGSGVGLALVGELARRMGGRAVAEQSREGGVCFAVELPEHSSDIPRG
jgi:two-component system sensor histidine kinase BaeS